MRNTTTEPTPADYRDYDEWLKKQSEAEQYELRLEGHAPDKIEGREHD